LIKPCVAIEDSLPGIESAKMAGMKTIGLTSSHSEEKLKHANIVINNLNELDMNKIQALF